MTDRSYTIHDLSLGPSLIVSLLVLSLFSLLAGGCATRTQSQLPVPAAGNSRAALEDLNRSMATAATQGSGSSADYRIGPEDLLQITLFNIPEADARVTPRSLTVRVSQQGMILLPLLGEISVRGLTVTDLVQSLRDQYVKYIRNPQIGVLVTEHRQRATVLGAVNKPGAYELLGPKTVIDLLVLAGGVSDRAGNQVHIFRQGPHGRQTHVIDLMLLANSTELIHGRNPELINMLVEAGDVISVPQAGMFFVEGAVAKPGSYPLGQRYTLTQALVTAGGVNADIADYGGINIYRRRGPTEVDTIPVDLGQIHARSVADPPVQPDDVIVVPTSAIKVFRQTVGQFFYHFLTGVTIGSFIYK